MRRNGRKTVGLLLSVVILLSVLSGCGGGNNNAGGESANNGSKNGGKSGGETVKLRMVESLTSPKRTELLQAMINQFMEENPTIKVELISPPFDQADNKIRAMLAGKQELDIMEVRDLNVAEFVNNKYTEPLNAYADKWADYATVTATAKSVGTVGENLYFVPSGLYLRQMFYRKDWLDEKGLKVPETWQELVDTAIALTDPAKNRFGFSFRGGPGSNGNTDTMILSYNGDNVNLDDSMFTKDGKSIFATPEAKQAMELYMKLYKEGSPPDSINWGFSEQVQAFTSGVTGILLQDPDVIQSLQQGMDEGTWATAPMPKGANGKALMAPGASGWGITSYSTHKEEAWKLIEFLSSPKQNTQFSKDYGLIPVHTAATEDEFFKSGPYKTLLDMGNQPDVFVSYKPPFQYAGTGQWGQVSSESQQSFLLGKTSVDDLLKKWDEYWMNEKSKMQK